MRNASGRSPSHRVVEGLLWATAVQEGPWGVKPRARGAKAAGLRFERQVAAALPRAIHGQWFKFEDANGVGFAQPDLLLGLGHRTVAILECKYSWVPEGHSQMELLYAPIVMAALRPDRLVLVQICRNLRPGASTAARICGTLEEAIECSTDGRAVWHWPAKAPALTGFVRGPLSPAHIGA